MKINWSRILGATLVLGNYVSAHTEADEKLTDDDLSLPDLAQLEKLLAPSVYILTITI